MRPCVEMAALTAVTASTTPLTPETSSTALWIVDRLSSAASASSSSDSFACSPASVSGVPSPRTSSTNSLVALSRSSTALCTVSAFRFPPLSEEAVDEIDSLQVVIAEQTSSAHSVAGAVASVVTAAAAGDGGGQQRHDEQCKTAAHGHPKSPGSVSFSPRTPPGRGSPGHEAGRAARAPPCTRAGQRPGRARL